MMEIGFPRSSLVPHSGSVQFVQGQAISDSFPEEWDVCATPGGGIEGLTVASVPHLVGAWG